MSNFIELTDESRIKNSFNVDYIKSFPPNDNASGTILLHESVHRIVIESYDQVKEMVQAKGDTLRSLRSMRRK